MVGIGRILAEHPGVRSLLVVAIASSACGASEHERAVDATPADVDVDLLVGVVPLDILFVIDDSGGMEFLQPQLAAALGRLDDQLGAGDARPILHVGVVTTDVPLLAPSGDGNCDGLEPTHLVANPCAALDPGDTYLEEWFDPVNGERDTNYAASFTETLGCMMQFEGYGCGLEQPLEAMKLALETPGFVRDLADLLVIVLSNEDDCSISSPAFFPSPSTNVGFRCFSQGVICDPDAPDEPGHKTGCTSRESSTTMFPVQRYVDFVRLLKPSPTQVTVGVIAATTTEATVQLETRPERLDLQPHCAIDVPAGTSHSFPAVRLGAFAAALGDDAITATTCDAEYDVLDAIGARAYRDIDSACLDRRARAECDLVWTAPGETILQLPACAATGGAGPCWELRDDATCSGSLQQIHIVTDGRAVAGSRVQGSCRPG